MKCVEVLKTTKSHDYLCSRCLSLCVLMQMVSRGCETTEMTLRRNGLGQLGFHVNFEGIIADVEPFGYAWKAGLRQGSRLVEICKVAVATLTHEQMIDLLRTSVSVKVVIIQPYQDGAPRRYRHSSYFSSHLCEFMNTCTHYYPRFTPGSCLE